MDLMSPIIVIFVLNEIIFWLITFIFFMLDINLSQTTLNKYKLYLPKAEMNKGYNWRVFGRIIINRIILLVVSFLIVTKFYKGHFFLPLPNLFTIIEQFVLIILIQDISFHFSHMLLHHKKFYGKIHKLHHEFKEPIAISAQYVHPIELIIISIPIIIGPIITRLHPLLFMLWIMVVTTFNVISHSGYFSKEHYLHHKLYNVNMGTNYWLDKLFGTYMKYDENKHKFLVTKPKILFRLSEKTTS